MPSLAVPLLADAAGVGVDHTALSYFLQQSLVEKKNMEEEEMWKRAEEEELRVPSSLPLSSLTPPVEEASLKRKRKKRKKRKLPRGGARLGYGRPCDPAAVPVLGRGASDSVHQHSVAFPVALQRRSYVVGLWVRIVILVALSHFLAWIFWVMTSRISFRIQRSAWSNSGCGSFVVSASPHEYKKHRIFLCSSWTRFLTSPLWCNDWFCAPDSVEQNRLEALVVPQLQFIDIFVDFTGAALRQIKMVLWRSLSY